MEDNKKITENNGASAETAEDETDNRNLSEQATDSDELFADDSEQDAQNEHKHHHHKKRSKWSKLKKNLVSFFKIRRAKKHGRREESIVVSDKLTSINECYNMLKDNILCISDGNKNKVFQIESSVAGEGKTTLLCNLAVSLSFNKKKVLVLDLDFRKPRVHRPFLIENENGIIDYLSDRIDLDTCIKHTSYDGVDIINRGSKVYNSSIILTSEKFKVLMKQLRDMYDFILIDAPPVLQISDFIHISKVTDGVIFAVAYAQTKRGQVREAMSLLKQNNINVLGTVLTFVDNKDPYSYYYTYYYGYGYHYYGED